MHQSIFNSEKLLSRLSNINKSGKRTPARLRTLVAILAEWAETAGTRDPAINPRQLQLDAQDIDALRYVIHQQVNAGRYANVAVLTDQILFIIVGAIRTQPQGNADKTWELTMLSIESLLNHAYQQRIPRRLTTACAALISLLILGGYGYAAYLSKSATLHVTPAYLPAPIFAPSPYIPTHVHSFRRIMQHATCEYPQAAMLPVEQRVVFLDFIRDGEFALVDLKNLESALSRVDCFYASTINNSVVN